MTLFTDFIFLTNEVEGFKQCRETRSETSTTAILCTAGHINVYYRGEMLRINQNDLFVRVPNATELGPYEISPDFQFVMIAIPNTIFEGLMLDHMRVEPRWWQKLEYLKSHPIFPLNEVSREFFHTYVHLLTLQLNDKLSDYRRQILQLIARGATMELLNYMDKVVTFTEHEISRQTVNSSDYTFHSFMHLLREHPHEREVQWYAKELGITPKYLSEICKERSGRSASEWIADITVSELKQYLRNTTLPIREIAKVMEFPNASFFCQYTKKHTGMTPNHFRKQKMA
jgi:YesN/AraC family two-component response regulator